jgi:signal transduction histidine kinase
MTRLRILFAIFTLALLAPIALLVQRSLHSVAIEQRMQQQTVAERIFDEMERELSQLLEIEEGRPVDAYETAVASEHESFLVSRFQVEARDAEREEGRSDAPAAAMAGEARAERHDDGLDAAAGLGDEVASVFRSPPPPEPETAARQAPGTTVRLDRGAAPARDEPQTGRAKSEAEVSEYDVLRSLNKAVRERVGARAVPAPSADIAPRRERAPSAGPEVLDLRSAAFGRSRMTGRAMGPDRIMLYRTVARAGAVYHQGIVIDVAALGDWLRERSIGGTALADHVRVELVAGGAEPGWIGADAALFRHRFAAPFAAISAHLQLRPLASGGSDLYVPALSLSLAIAVLLGLALLYRAVAVTMRFAERRSNFAAAVSHELKTPLTAIRMYGEMLRDGVVPSDAKRQEYYRHITSESERLSRLINNVLEFARLEKGNRLTRPIVAPIAATTTEVVEMMRPHAAEHGYDLVLDLAPDLPAVRHEPDAFAQVLWNLIDNAIKYARGATDRRIVVSARRAGDRVVVAVRDHGPGVDPRQQREIFSPFYRGEDELTRTASGAGLGLSLVRSLAERMGAAVRGSNHPDGGFVVEISLRVV